MPLLLPVLLVFAAALQTVFAAWTYPGCADVTDSDFRRVRLVQRGGPVDGGLDEPLKLALDPSGGVLPDVYYVERKGKVKRYDAKNKTMQLLGQLDVHTGEDQGVNGIALDPAFAKNRWIYLYYSPKAKVVFRLSRFTLGPAGLDMGSERILLDIPTAERRDGVWHTSGAMAFDAYGDLWINIGKNSTDDPRTMSETVKSESAEWSSSCTANLRGGILRIHPDPADPRGYTIPKGNFGEHFADKLRREGNAALASQYADAKKVLPEVYVKGTRNAYTIAVDPVRRWVAWGCVGPNRREVHEEFNLAKEPGFHGFPYFAGANLSLVGSKDPLKPRNTSKWCAELGGVQDLPPALPATYPYVESAAMTGPLYRHDPASPSAVKFPPHFHRLWIVGDWNAPGWFKTLTLDSAGAKVTAEQPLFKNMRGMQPLDIQAGPDGAIYVVNYTGWFDSNGETSIDRIEYIGPPCQAKPDLVVEKAGCRDPRYAEYDPAATHAWPEACKTATGAGPRLLPPGKVTWSLAGDRLRLDYAGDYVVEFAALDGRVVARMPGSGTGDFALPARAEGDVLSFRLLAEAGIYRGGLLRPR